MIGLSLACAPPRGGWNADRLEKTQPALAAISGHRLDDTPPFFTVASEEVILFLCRFSTSAAIAVALPADADVQERALFRRTLRAYESAGLGITFREVADPTRAQIEIRFSDPGRGGRELSGTGETRADCAISSDFATPLPPDGRVAADLGRALILLRRYNLNAINRPIPLEPFELLAATLHELGHALGYPGHTNAGDSVMANAIEAPRRIARRVLDGAAFRDATLEALYAVPSGAVVGRIDVRKKELEALLGLAQRAPAAELRGPYVRVGDQSARIFWRGAYQSETALDVRAWREVVKRRERFVLEANRRARVLLAAP